MPLAWNRGAAAAVSRDRENDSRSASAPSSSGAEKWSGTSELEGDDPRILEGTFVLLARYRGATTVVSREWGEGCDNDSRYGKGVT